VLILLIVLTLAVPRKSHIGLALLGDTA